MSAPLFYANNLMGMRISPLDVQLVPPFMTPTPFPNVDTNAMCNPGTLCMKVVMVGGFVQTLATMKPMTQGSPLIGSMDGAPGMGPAQNTDGSMKVFYEGMPGHGAMNMRMKNLTNVPPQPVIPDAGFQTKVMGMS
ncbi:hypothetical protein [Dongshaea marina]|uniref:hypothetical protein n=1 Tax=Dongshaea marina TaxID=2047966 RepID=UPI000D3E4B50|nr:hypothetical protein [Dongshaea marina]